MTAVDAPFIPRLGSNKVLPTSLFTIGTVVDLTGGGGGRSRLLLLRKIGGGGIGGAICCAAYLGYIGSLYCDLNIDVIDSKS